MTAISRRKHPRHDAWFSELSLGASSWSKLDGAEGDRTALAVTERAWQIGIRYFDTAPYYGSGLCERRLGSGLAWKDTGDYLLSTKVGIDLDPFGQRKPVAHHYPHYAPFTPVCDYSRDGIRRSFETSLHRLGIVSCDIAYMHGLSICDGGIDAALGTGMPALLELRDAGHVRMVGVGANSPAIAMAFLERYDIDVLLFAGGFTLTDHAGAGPVVEECAKRNIGIIAASPFANGAYFAAENTADRQRLQVRCAEYGISDTAAVIQFGLNFPSVLSVLWSTTKPENVDRTVAALNETIPAAFWERLREDGALLF
ncbi:aldo/keto reductase [Rhizobium sp. 2MFCol3.1]|uniref:aldo/keto reductase n=1 Tax=Rhizobium sp. 2MFCol3.1 TaxID=1246459 RepID=UPI0003A13CC1|nr:aldo/keto reductase [Rhizobium sp. 2MFCol3.1]